MPGVKLSRRREVLRPRQGHPRRLDGDRARRVRRLRRPLRLRQVDAAADDRRARGDDRRHGSRSRARDVTEEEPARRGVAMVFQSYALYPHLTRLREHGLQPPPRPRGRGRRSRPGSARPRASCSLEDHLQKKPSQLSGGQRQRVAIGRAIVREPKVFLFDEPLSNLDAELRVQMRLELARLHQQIGATMIYVTHDQVEAMTLADKIFVLQSGVVRQVGAAARALRRPRQPLRRRLHRLAEHELPARQGGRRDRDRGRRSRPTACDGHAGHRKAARRPAGGRHPGHARDAPRAPRDRSRRRRGGCRSTVDMEEDLGGVSYLHARTPAGQPIVLERRGSRENFEGRRDRRDGVRPTMRWSSTRPAARVR